MRARVILAVLLVVLAGCTSSGNGNGRGRCGSGCTGTIHAAHYAIVMPKKWNGTLLLFSHAYRQPQSAGAMLPTVSIGDPKGKGTDPVARAMLARGYALAGSSYAEQGWATKQGLSAADDLYARFVQLHGKPKHTYAWGASLGGLVTELLAERASWVDGAAAFCGVVGGPTRNFDNFLEAAWATKVLLLPSLKVTGFASAAEAAEQGRLADLAIAAAAREGARDATARALFVADLVGMPDHTAGFAAGTPQQRLSAKLQALTEYVGLAFSVRYDMERRFGGNPAQTSADTSALTAADAAEITALRGDVATYRGMLAAAAPVTADPAARAAATASGDPSGLLRAPLITMHDVYDPLAIVANETVLRDRVAAGGQAGRLVQTYVGAGGPSYGLTHCAFSPRQVVAALVALDRWVRTGSQPTAQAIAAAAGSGVQTGYAPPAWPSGG